MKIYFFAFLFILLVQQNYVVNNRDKYIGFIKDNKFHIRDSTALKSKMLSVVTINDPDISELNKIEIKKVRTLGDKEIAEYLLIGYNYERQLKVARCLRLKKELFFLEEDLKKLGKRDDFYSTYFICQGSDTNCFPNVVLMNSSKSWVPNSILACLESDCKCLKILVDYE